MKWLRALLAALVCRVRGHDWQTRGFQWTAGTSVVTRCRRCGRWDW